MINDPGDPKGWGDMLDWGRRMYRGFKSNIPVSGIGATVTEGPTGRSVNANAVGGGGSTAAVALPFSIIQGPVIAGVPQIGVYFLSTIFQSLTVTDNLAITGLLASINPSDSDPGWFPVPIIGGKIWLQIGITDPTQTIIQHANDVSSIWDEYPDISINTDDPSNPYQEFYNVLIGEITDPETDDRPASFTVTVGTEQRQITQMYNRDILLTKWAVEGIVATIPADPTLIQLATA